MTERFNIDPFLTPSDRQVLLASAFGALVSLFFLGRISALVALQALAAGLLSAYYATPVAGGLLHWGADRYGFLGFVIGLFAMSFYSGLFALFALWRADPGGFIARVLAWLPLFNKGGRNGN